MVSTRCYCGFMPKAHKKSLMVSKLHIQKWQNLIRYFKWKLRLLNVNSFFLQMILFFLIPMTIDFLRWTIIGPLPEILCSTSVWIKNVIFSNVCIINFAKVSFICTLSNFIFFIYLTRTIIIHGTDHGPMMTRSQILYSPKPYPKPK